MNSNFKQQYQRLSQLRRRLKLRWKNIFHPNTWSKKAIVFILFASLSLVGTLGLPAISQPEPKTQSIKLAQQGKDFYEAGKLDQAIKTWQQASLAYREAGDLKSSSENAINTATAQQALGLYPQSCESLLQAFNVTDSVKCSEILEQAQQVEPRLDGTLPPNQESESKDKFVPAINKVMQLPSSANKATGLLRMGDYLKVSGYPRAAIRTLELSLETANEINDSTQITSALLSLGNSERAISKQKQDRFPPQTIALNVISNQGASSEAAFEPYKVASDYYRQAAQAASTPLDTLKAELNHLSLLLDASEFWQTATNELIDNIDQAGIADPDFLQQTQEGARQLQAKVANKLQPEIVSLTNRIEPQIDNLALTRAGIYSKINFAQSLIRQGRTDKNTAQILAKAIEQSRQINNITAEAEAMGYWGYLYEKQQQYVEAQRLTEGSLQLASTTEYPEIAYRWNAQLGRILAARGNRNKALTAYESSFNTIRALRSDLATTPVEPIFREYISLLLEEEPNTQQLDQARDVLESLQIVKLDNFFRDPCSQVANEPVIIDEVDSTAAVVYPILLQDRLEVILTLPGQPLRHYATTGLNKEKVENTIKQLRRSSLTNPGFAEEIRGVRGNPQQTQQIQVIQQSLEESLEQDILPPASEIYSWLIEPAEADIEASGVKTLVFVLDGSLRNIPMTLLYDQKNQQYLIEKNYDIALSSGLQLTNPEPLTRQPIKVLAAGVTNEFPEYQFPPIPKVEDELNQIKKIFGDSKILLNQEFTFDSLQQELKISDFPVVHLATHGQFSSTSDETFILSGEQEPEGNPIINVNQFDNLLRVGSLRRSQPIELLVLSACNTAEGDNQAVLGLAGVAVRAGARSTLATLWGANDDATSVLMGKFYENLAANTQLTKAHALREAQLDLLKTEDSQYRHPYYWAPFVLIGNWL
ncbi:MAG: CHAT domain-containing protein [Pleurocapsa sp.]